MDHTLKDILAGIAMFAFMKFRAAKLAADPSVDTFFNRGEHAARFAYFDE